MKTIVSNLATVVANVAMLAITVGFSYSANAQSVRLPGEEIKLTAVLAASEMPATSEFSGMVGVLEPTETAEFGSETPYERQPAAGQTDFPRSIERPTTGEIAGTPAAGTTNSLADENSVTVRVSYEGRLIGGIVTVQASIAPTFSGVGVSSRPEIVRSVSMAVDAYDAELISEVTRELTAEIKEEYAAR